MGKKKKLNLTFLSTFGKYTHMLTYIYTQLAVSPVIGILNFSRLDTFSSKAYAKCN